MIRKEKVRVKMVADHNTSGTSIINLKVLTLKIKEKDYSSQCTEWKKL